jgi:hypothetical protein
VRAVTLWFSRLSPAAPAQPTPTPERIAAWQALSDLFLDTAHDDASLAAIARQLRATGLQVNEVERIYEEEVAPVCWRNLLSIPGGVWSGFQREWLVDNIQRHISRPKPLHHWSIVQRLRAKRWTAMTREDWLRVRRLLN